MVAMSPADDAGALRVPAAILLSPIHTHIMVVMSVPVFLTAHQCIDGKGGGTHIQTLPC